jgi:hypothetical protein
VLELQAAPEPRCGHPCHIKTRLFFVVFYVDTILKLFSAMFLLRKKVAQNVLSGPRKYLTGKKKIISLFRTGDYYL